MGWFQHHWREFEWKRAAKVWIILHSLELNLIEYSLNSKASRPAKQKRAEENADEASSNQFTIDDAQTIDISKFHNQELLSEDPIAADEDVDVRGGVGQVTYSITCEQSDEERPGMSKKRRFRQTLSSVLLQIHREKEEARERRHQEKMELLRLLLQWLKKYKSSLFLFIWKFDGTSVVFFHVSTNIPPFAQETDI